MYTVDLHTHTRFFHGRRALGDRFDPVGYRLLAAAARCRGLDGVATTNHDYYTRFPDSLGTTALPGNEITTTRGHLLVVGPDPPAETDPGELTPEEAVEVAHDRGCAAVLAHPYRNSTIREGRIDARVDDRLPYRLLRGLYRRIHEHKRQLDSPEGPTPGIGDPPGEEPD